MKKLALLFGLLFFLAIGNVNAQSVVTQETWDSGIYYECDGVWGLALGMIDFNYITHFNKDGNVDWYKMTAHSNELVNPETGEEFNLSYEDKEDGWESGAVIEMTYHFNLVGDMGTHLIYSITYQFDTSTGVFTLVSEKAKCL